jgi:hypothetical protein
MAYSKEDRKFFTPAEQVKICCLSSNPSQHPTLGAHPDKSEWFHCTRIHTIVDERLVAESSLLRCLLALNRVSSGFIHWVVRNAVGKV